MRSKYPACLFIVLLLVSPAVCSAQDEGQPKRAVNFPKIKEVSPGVLQVGTVTVNKNTKTVTFPATINMSKGLLEYFLVQDGGKTHESMLSTRIEPYHLHLAMLLLGAKVPKQDAESQPPDAIDAEYLKTAPKLQGDAVLIKVKWNDGTKDVEVDAEDLITNDAKKAPMTRGPWTYNGSMLKDGVFLAQVERSIIALVIDPTALINNTRPGSDNDQIWEARSEKSPKDGTPVEVSMRLQSDTPAPAAKPAP